MNLTLSNVIMIVLVDHPLQYPGSPPHLPQHHLLAVDLLLCGDPPPHGLVHLSHHPGLVLLRLLLGVLIRHVPVIRVAILTG